MNLSVTTFHLQKEGNRAKDYEDGFAASPDGMRVAIADGAASGFESRAWADALVHAFSILPPAFDKASVADWLVEPQSVWNNFIRWDELKWYHTEKARHGAYATLLGLTFAPSPEVSPFSLVWSAMAIGDACLLQIRGDKIICQFPMEKADDFGVNPPLLSTRLDYNDKTLDEIKTRSGDLQPDDVMILATDALSEWLYTQIESGETSWHNLLHLTQAQFEEYVAGLRREHKINNDDITLLLVRLLPHQCSKDVEESTIKLDREADVDLLSSTGGLSPCCNPGLAQQNTAKPFKTLRRVFKMRN